MIDNWQRLGCWLLRKSSKAGHMADQKPVGLFQLNFIVPARYNVGVS